MAVLKCKMCGGTMEITNESVAVCEYCGTTQTVPTVKDENLQGLFNRANVLRIKCEFDKAEQLYEKIISADNTQAEAYWGLILCKYGIEYVEDPSTFKRVPTCHRTSFDSIIADDDYAAALDFADAASQKIYEAEAKEIDRLQKEILAISQKEEPYDVFICYKETDETGKRTQDSVIANDIYYQLTQEGFKVFYAAITLEDKLGSAYEPCIFAALNSSKVMLAIGTKPEYFTAVWVKNEWSRYLKLMKKDRTKLLIPCYRDMDAYELPDEFAHLQAQDMSKIGFINDVVRGIKKVIVKDEPTANTHAPENISTTVNVKIEPLIERAFMFLEDGDWQSANEYCEKVLDQDPKFARAYLGKLMAEIKIKEQKDLVNCATPFDNSNNYTKAIRFGDAELGSFLEKCNDTIKERNETNRLSSIYNKGLSMMEKATSEAHFLDASKVFHEISHWKDSQKLADECIEKAEILRKDGIYETAKKLCDSGNPKKVNEGIALLETISGWKDVDSLLANKDVLYRSVHCVNVYSEANRIYILAKRNIEQNVLIDKSVELLQSALEKYESIDDWLDASKKAEECRKFISENIIMRLKQKREIILSGIQECKGMFAAKKRKEFEAELRQVDEELKKLGF